MDTINLLHLLNEDIGTAQQLLELLDAEFSALSQRDLKRLEQLLGEKQPLLQLLELHGQQRSQQLSMLNLSSDREGLAIYAQAHMQGQELLTQADQLEALLNSCRQANERNAKLIRSNQASVTSVLNILQGQDTPSLYDSRGTTTRSANQRPLSQA